MNSVVATKTIPSREKVWQMFDRIAHRYDLLNHLLSLGQDIRWRLKVKEALPDKTGLEMLDLATGTGDQIFYLIKDARIKHAVGIDLAAKMLEIGHRKAAQRGLSQSVQFKTGDACALEFAQNTFDIVTISFGIRNVMNLEQVLNQMYRVLKPGGRAIILEFSLPEPNLFRRLYLFYFRKILPRLGTLVSGDAYAYRYLNQTVETFPFGEDFCKLLTRAGFTKVNLRPLTFGIVSIYLADKGE